MRALVWKMVLAASLCLLACGANARLDCSGCGVGERRSVQAYKAIFLSGTLGCDSEADPFSSIIDSFGTRASIGDAIEDLDTKGALARGCCWLCRPYKIVCGVEDDLSGSPGFGLNGAGLRIFDEAVKPDRSAGAATTRQNRRAYVNGHVRRRIAADILDFDFQQDRNIVIGYAVLRPDLSDFQPRPVLASHDFVGGIGRLSGGAGGLVGVRGQAERVQQDSSANRDQDSLIEAIVSHLLSRFVHPLLSSKIVQFSLLGTLFSGVSGLGLSFVFDDVDRKRPRRLMGLGIVSVSLPLAIIFLTLLAVRG